MENDAPDLRPVILLRNYRLSGTGIRFSLFKPHRGFPASVQAFPSSHGGLSPQECVVPELIVTALDIVAPESLRLLSFFWQGLRLRLEWSDEPDGFTMDLRTAANDYRTSLVNGARPIGKSILIADEDLEGENAYIVALDEQQKVVVQEPIRIGG